ncbi:hypothetical protein ACTMU2_37055 [Cupriavidus basilensis]
MPLSKLEETQIPAIVLISEGATTTSWSSRGVRGDRVLIRRSCARHALFRREHFESVWESPVALRDSQPYRTCTVQSCG